MECKGCEKYTVSCSVLEGFECCKCCGVGECAYDICPPEEKLPIRLTRKELYYRGEISYMFNTLYNLKSAFMDDRFYRSDYYRLKGTKEKIIKVRDMILNDSKIRPHIKARFLKDINSGLSSYKDLIKLLRNMVYSTKKGGNFNYYKRNLYKFSPETIGKIKKLSREERYKLLKLKGVSNPLILIK